MSSSASPKSGFDSLYADHQGWLCGWLRRRLGDGSEAADLAQDTFLRILASRSLGDTWGERPRALLTHIAKGIVADHWRRKSIERAWLETLAHLPADLAPSAEDRLVMVETLVRIDQMLRELPVFTREVFLLAQFEGLTLDQISRRTDAPVITVRRHIRKALVACMDLAGAGPS